MLNGILPSSLTCDNSAHFLSASPPVCRPTGRPARNCRAGAWQAGVPRIIYPDAQKTTGLPVDEWES